MDEIMAAFDRLFPNAGPFERGGYEHKMRYAVEELKEAGYRIVKLKHEFGSPLGLHRVTEEL